MMNEMKLITKSNNVDEAGVVTVAVAAFGNTDSQNDISERGSFTKTLKENRKRFKHFLNHNQDLLVGCPIDAYEDARHLVFVSEINLETQLGRDVYSNYKLYQKNGLTLEHSVGVEDVKRDPFDRRKVLEWVLWEFSTLYSWGANERTPLLDLKQLGFGRNPSAAIHFVRDALKLKFSDKTLVQYEGYLNLIEKAMAGESRMAACECGLKFDYDSVPEETLEKQVLEAARNMLQWRTQGIVEQEIAKLDTDLRMQVTEILEKGRDLSHLTGYVHCPRCGRRIYRSDIIVVDGAQKRSVVMPMTKGGKAGGLSLKAIGGLINGK